MQVQLKKQHSRYSKYKQTGIPWLSEVPERWSMEKLKFIAPVQNKKIANPSSELQYIALENVESWTGKLINLNEKAEFESIVNEFEVGDVLFGKLRPYLAKVVPTEFNGVCTGEMLVLRPNENKILKKFLFYMLISNAVIDVVNNSTYGAKMPRANWGFIGNLLLGFPKPEEQKVIANYLDEKSALIERIIEAKQRQIALLKEKRSSLINRAVTKGIRTKVMFDTNAFDQWQKLSKKDQDKLLERVEIIYTHIQEDELPSDLRGVLPSAKKVLTSGAIFDISRYDNCTYGGEEDSSNISAVVGSGKKENHNKDALIANTAKMQNDLLITDDQRLQKKCSEISGEAIPFKEFIARFEMKDSGVEWIGEVPKHWAVKKLKYCGEIVLGKMLQDKSKRLDDQQKQYLRAQNIRWEAVDVSDVREMYFSDYERTKFRLKKGDLLVSEGGEVGRTSLWKNELDECYIQNSVNRVRVFSSNVSRFFLYQFESFGSGRVFFENVNRVSIAHLTREKLKEFHFLVPTSKEQQKITEYLETETEGITTAFKKIEQSIALLQEYKTSLVSSVVTGKVKITYEN